jgi:hypothetical protein
MGSVNLDNTGSGSAITLSSDGTSLLLDGTAIGGGGGDPDLYRDNLDAGATTPSATGSNAVSIGSGSSSSGLLSIAFGYAATSTAQCSTAIGASSGLAGSRAIANGAVALGGSSASGVDSFAVAIASNSSSYGAAGGNSVAIGQQARASGLRAVAIGYSALATATRSYALSAYGNATQAYGATLFGARAASSVQGKAAYGPAYLVGQGQVQGGMLVCTVQTTDATASTLTTTNGTAGTTNQVVLPNNSAYSFSGTIIARQQAADGSDYASWEIKGALLRDANAASTVLGNGIVNKLFATTGASAWAIALTADTTNGGLKIEATGAAATDIRWVATVNTSEVTYA